MRAALQVGAAIGHHHGVGRLKTPFLADDQRDGMTLLCSLKRPVIQRRSATRATCFQ